MIFAQPQLSIPHHYATSPRPLFSGQIGTMMIVNRVSAVEFIVGVGCIALWIMTSLSSLSCCACLALTHRASSSKNDRIDRRQCQSSLTTNTIATVQTNDEDTNNNHVIFRPYDPTTDYEDLIEICKDVYGGTDYLPSMAMEYAKDPKSQFMVLSKVEDSGGQTIVAVANLKLIISSKSKSIRWIEAVRTCPKHRGQGLAQHLLSKMMELSQNSTAEHTNSEIWSSTIESNLAMRTIFEKIGLNPRHYIHQLKFDKLNQIPGWSVNDASGVTPKPLLEACGLVDSIRKEAKQIKWSPVDNLEDLNQVLQKIKEQGGIGCLPGLYKILDDKIVQHSLNNGLVWKLEEGPATSGDVSLSSNAVPAGPAIVALTTDAQIQSLKSNQVCSIAATTTIAFESALWYVSKSFGCFDDNIEHSDIAAASTSKMFTLSVDGAVPLREEEETSNAVPVYDKLPFVGDRCILYGSSFI